MCYVESAKECLAASGHQSTLASLQHSLEVGRDRQIAYYNVRAHGITENQRHIIARLFAEIPLGATVGKEQILRDLEKEYSEKEAGEVFRRSLRRGVLDERANGAYAIPIPSMQKWLVDLLD